MARGNTKNFIGILTEDQSIFDVVMRRLVKRLIVRHAARLRQQLEAEQDDRCVCDNCDCAKTNAKPLTRMRLAHSLGIDRNRLSRIVKALNITGLFD